MSPHQTPRNPLATIRILLIPTLVLLASCQSLTGVKTTTARKPANGDGLSGRNTLSAVTIRTTGSNVAMSGTTVDGRHIKSQGRTTRQAVDNLTAAAQASR